MRFEGEQDEGGISESATTEQDLGGQVPEERRCTHIFADGRRCKQRRWRGKELCFQHDPEAAELRKNAGRQASALKMLTATEVHDLLTRTLEGLRAKRVTPGEAYAVGYLAQLLLGNLEAVGKEYDWVRTQWDRYQEIAWRVRALDEGTYEIQEAQEAEEAREGTGDPSLRPSAARGAGKR